MFLIAVAVKFSQFLWFQSPILGCVGFLPGFTAQNVMILVRTPLCNRLISVCTPLCNRLISQLNFLAFFKGAFRGGEKGEEKFSTVK